MEAATDPALRHLLPALNRLREPWISAFFNPTKEQHLSQLEHALNNPTFTGTLYLSATSTIPSEGTTPDLTFIFAPSFSTGSTTVGFDLTHRTVPTNSAELESSQLSVSRAVRDDATGIFLSITRLPTHTEIALSRLTPNGRTISLVTLTNAAYDHLVDGNRVPTCTLSAAKALHSGTISVLYAEDNLSPAPCTKLHPMDFAAEQRNVECFVSGFESVAQVRQYYRGSLTGRDRCFARMGISATRDGIYMKGMRDWAIEQAVTGCRIRVPSLCVPGSEMDVEEDTKGMDAGRLNLSTGKVGEFGADDVVKLLAGLDDTLHDARFDETALALMNGGDEQNVPMLKDGLEDISIFRDVASSRSSIISAITEAPPHASVPQDAMSDSPQEGYSSPRQTGNHPAKENCMRELAPRRPTNSAYVIENIVPRRAVPIAPAEMNLAERTVVSESQRKDEQRRARNRASALRSNEKKRVYLKKLKEDLASAEKREDVLRERERLLRQENRELRIALRH